MPCLYGLRNRSKRGNGTHNLRNLNKPAVFTHITKFATEDASYDSIPALSLRTIPKAQRPFVHIDNQRIVIIKIMYPLKTDDNTVLINAKFAPNNETEFSYLDPSFVLSTPSVCEIFEKYLERFKYHFTKETFQYIKDSIDNSCKAAIPKDIPIGSLVVLTKPATVVVENGGQIMEIVRHTAKKIDWKCRIPHIGVYFAKHVTVDIEQRSITDHKICNKKGWLPIAAVELAVTKAQRTRFGIGETAAKAECKRLTMRCDELDLKLETWRRLADRTSLKASQQLCRKMHSKLRDSNAVTASSSVYMGLAQFMREFKPFTEKRLPTIDWRRRSNDYCKLSLEQLATITAVPLAGIRVMNGVTYFIDGVSMVYNNDTNFLSLKGAIWERNGVNIAIARGEGNPNAE